MITLSSNDNMTSFYLLQLNIIGKKIVIKRLYSSTDPQELRNVKKRIERKGISELTLSRELFPSKRELVGNSTLNEILTKNNISYSELIG